MLAKNTRASVAAVVAALITGVMVALLVALMPTPAQAQSGDVLLLKKLTAVDITNNECPGDCADDPLILIDSRRVWSANDANRHLKNGQSVNFDGKDAPLVSETLSGDNAEIQLWEMDPGVFQGGDEHIGNISAAYTDGKEHAENLIYKNGEATYTITYEVDRAPTPTNTSPEILDLSPTPGSSTQNRTPLISATIRDAETDLSASKIKFFVDGNAKTFPYDQASDKLSYQSAELAAGQHTVRIEATDEKGLQTVKDWSFTVENTSTTPPGGGSGINNPPTISPVTPAPDSKVKNRAPLISATVTDTQTDLDGTTIKLFLDGSERTASYDKASDKLTYQSAKLAPGQHTVRIEATDASGLKGENTWNFKVVRRH